MIQIYYQKEPVISAPCVHRVLAGHRVCHEQEEPQGWCRLVWEIRNKSQKTQMTLKGDQRKHLVTYSQNVKIADASQLKYGAISA